MLAGTGTGRKRLLPALRESTMCRVTVVQGRDPGRLREVARQDASIRLVTDPVEFIRSRDLFDVVYLASPPFLRGEHLALAAAAGKPVLCEKPLAISEAHLTEVCRVVAEAGMPFGVAHHLRHQPAVTDLAELLRDGSLGALQDSHLRWNFVMDLAAPNASWKVRPHLAGSSSMWDSGVHALDLVVLLFGVPRAVCAVGQRRRTPELVDAVTAILDFGTHTVTVTTSQAGVGGGNDLVVTGSTAVVRAPGMLGERSLRTLLVEGGPRGGRRDYPATDLYRAMVEDFCRWLQGAPAVGTTMSEAVTTSRLLLAIEESVARGRTIELR
ncbi:Gfo/Idh/MocA family protein [Micromonospora sp. NPDC049282]|uniref:Gfo/Idh/MocA family protein n=1 Tax=Micromonospora sp. NPDC049282 TaxID=3364269 RepID=UPI00371BB49C